EQILKEQQIVEKKMYLMGKFDPSQRSDFILIPQKYSVFGVDNMYLRKETLEAFVRMEIAAGKDGMELKIASATRNFDSQKNLWNRQWSDLEAATVNGENSEKNTMDSFAKFKKTLQYIAVPGTSRHHWGTEIDINGANVPYFETEQGVKEYQ